MNNLFILSIGLLTLLSCKKKKVQSCFEASHSEAFVDEIIQFDNCSKNTVKTEWNFGDGGSSEIQSPSHKFEDTGEYVVSLSEFDEKGDNSTSKNSIQVYTLRLSKIKFEGINFNSLNFTISLYQYGILTNNNELYTETTNNSYTVNFVNPFYVENIEHGLSIDTYQTIGQNIHSVVWTFDCFKEVNRDTKQLILKDETTGITATVDFEFTY